MLRIQREEGQYAQHMQTRSANIGVYQTEKQAEVGVAGAMNNILGGINQQITPGAVPPPIPVDSYHIAVNGQATGPFDISVLNQLASSGQFTADSLVWKNGMKEWKKAGTVEELKKLFPSDMPPIPPLG